MEKQKYIKIGLWVNKDKEGVSYMSGNYTFNSKVFIRKNTFKKQDKDPDYFLSFVPTDKEEEHEEKKLKESIFDAF